MYSYPINPEEMRIIFEGFCESALGNPTSEAIVRKFATYFGYEKEDDQ